MPAQNINRRHLLLAGATGGAAALLTGTAAPARAAPATPLPLTAQTTEGPYYLDVRQERADITEGLSGVPLDVIFTVREVDGRLFAGARVDIWHCDAGGLYSGFAGQGDDRAADATGKTFLRGHLMTDAGGIARFSSIYPGWYEGRTTHIHFKVWNGARVVLTSQFFLPDALSEFLYTNMEAYRRARLRGVLNSNDGIALMAGETVVGAVRETLARYVASLDVVVDRDAVVAADWPPPPGARPFGPPPAGMRRPPDGLRPMPRGASLEGPARAAALIPGSAETAR